MLAGQQKVEMTEDFTSEIEINKGFSNTKRKTTNETKKYFTATVVAVHSNKE
jgi:hypothetical protein